MGQYAHRRDELFGIYQQYIAEEPHAVIYGEQAQRLEIALAAIRAVDPGKA